MLGYDTSADKVFGPALKVTEKINFGKVCRIDQSSPLDCELGHCAYSGVFFSSVPSRVVEKLRIPLSERKAASTISMWGNHEVSISTVGARYCEGSQCGQSIGCARPIDWPIESG